VGGTATFAANPTLSAGTANQVQYLNASKVLVGSANLTFDGTALTLGGNPTLSAGTANGVTYLNGSKVLTSGSALTFNGTSLGVASVASTAALSLSSATSTAINLNIGGTELARLSANVNGIFTVGTEGSVPGIGTGYATLGAYGTNGGGFRIYRGTGAGTQSAIFYADSTGTFFGSAENTSLLFYQNNTERARISSDGTFRVKGAGTAGSTDAVQFSGSAPASAMTLDASGNLLVGTTSQPVSGVTTRLAVVQSTGDYSQVINNTNASPYGLYIKHNTDSNGSGNPFIAAIGNATTRFAVRSDGGIENYSANNVNLSDRREKTNFAPAKSYLDTICAIPVQTFNYIDQSEDDPGLTLGVVAQDVQAVAPELVMESNWGTAEEPKQRLSIYQTDLQYALMKCVQELKAQNDELRARVAALEA
jgi:hypothetical protein